MAPFGPETMTDSEVFRIHTEPVWRDRSNFIINAELRDRRRWFEQLFARRVSDRNFEVCCIPFFLYDVALGDLVSTSAEGARMYDMDTVVRPSGRWVFRAWFGESSQPQDQIVDELKALGSLMERHGRNLLAIDAADEERARIVAQFLAERESVGQLIYETGRA